MSKNAELESLEAALAEIPIFPLPQVVLFPRALLPLHIFEPRYRTMVKDALETHRALAIALITDASDRDVHGHPKIASVTGGGVILEQQRLPDGRSNIVLHGVARLRLEELPFVPPYRRARGTILREVSSVVPSADRTALLAEATAFSGEIAKRDSSFSFHLPPSIEPAGIADLAAHHLVIDAGARQRILEELDVLARVRLVTAELAIQRGALRALPSSTLH